MIFLQIRGAQKVSLLVQELVMVPVRLQPWTRDSQRQLPDMHGSRHWRPAGTLGLFGDTVRKVFWKLVFSWWGVRISLSGPHAGSDATTQ